MRSLYLVGIAALSLLHFPVPLHAQSIQTFRDCDDCPEMVQIPPGSFTMGVSAGEEEREGMADASKGASVPQHRVTVGAFALGTYAVTRGEFAAFVRDTGYQTGDTCYVIYKDGDQWKAGDKAGHSWRDPNFTQTDRHPAVCVSWNDAKAYVAWLSKKTGHTYRLPSEAEWEYAARANSGTARFWSDDSKQTCSYANVGDAGMAGALGRNKADYFQCSDGHMYTAPVGQFRPNAYGLYDIHGNVWQWIEDCWNKNYQGAPVDGSAWVNGECGTRVERGGSWYSRPYMVRAAFRYGLDAALRKVYLGFRVARTQ